MRSSTRLMLLSLAVGATIIALFGHEHLPERRLTLLIPHTSTGIPLEPYADQSEGGPSHSEVWGDTGSYIWRCRVEEAGSFSYCGVAMPLSASATEGIDLSDYSAVRARLTPINHSAGVRLVIRHFDRNHFQSVANNAAQFNTVNIRPQDLAPNSGEIVIKFNEFATADWWKLMYDQLPREAMRPRFENVVLIGFDYGEQLAPGDYQTRLESLEIVGKWISVEHWYLSILLLWLVAIASWIGRHFFMLRQQALHHRHFKRESEKYRELSRTDALTQLFNRFGLEQMLLDLSNDIDQLPLSLVLLDIDHFKTLNDRYGHNVGDQVLQSVAQTLKQYTRAQDVVCRWGGEEFLILAPGTDVDSASQIAEKLRAAIETLTLPDPVSGGISASFGASEIHYGESYIEALARADTALYHSKRFGRNRVTTAA